MDEAPETTCGHCQKTSLTHGARLLRCSRCRQISYCSRDCQKSDWKHHKLICTNPNTSTTHTVDSGVDLPILQRVPLHKIKDWMHTLLKDATDLLFDELLFCPSSALSQLSFDNLEDDVSNSQSGFSFLSNPHNISYLERFRIDPIENLEAQPGGDLLVTYPDIEVDSLADIHSIDLKSTKKTFSWMAAAAYNTSAMRFLELLLLAILFTGGLPPYGDDLLYISIANAERSLRGIYIADKMVLIRTLDDDPVQRQTTARYVTADVGLLIILYLKNVLPLTPWKENNFLFASSTIGRPWPKQRYSKLLEDETGKGLGIKLGLKEVRHMYIEISSTYLGDRLNKDGYVR